MPYPDYLTAPMREELTRIGARECRTAAEVDETLKSPGVTMMVVNSVCGCAAGKARQLRAQERGETIGVRAEEDSVVLQRGIGGVDDEVFAQRGDAHAARKEFAALLKSSVQPSR